MQKDPQKKVSAKLILHADVKRMSGFANVAYRGGGGGPSRYSGGVDC